MKKEREPFWTGPGYRGEYNCPHGVGHGNHIHGCDGCCQRDDFPLRNAPHEKDCDCDDCHGKELMGLDQ